MERLGKISKVFDAPEAIADIKYRDTTLINAEIERLTRLSAVVKPRATEFFMNAPSPGIVATTMLNAHYASHEAYLDAAASATPPMSAEPTSPKRAARSVKSVGI